MRIHLEGPGERHIPGPFTGYTDAISERYKGSITRIGPQATSRVARKWSRRSTSTSQKLYRPFFKLTSEAANPAPGVRLDLAISLRLDQQMQGDISIDPTIKNGSRFVLTLSLE